MRYVQLTMTERQEIAKARTRPVSLRDVAEALGRAPSTISREVRRNGRGSFYEASEAQSRARARREVRVHRLDHPRIRQEVRVRLEQKWSPEQIAHTLTKEGLRVSVQTLYTFLRRQDSTWTQSLRHQHRWGVPGYRQPGKYQRIRGFKPIEERPSIANRRGRVGDWESDTICLADRNTGIATHVDRRTGYVVLALLPDRSAATYNQATQAAFLRHGDLPAHTFTVDHGMEFACFKDLERALDVAVYFAHPHRAWERGCNENLNGLLRQYFPKHRDFDTISEHQLLRVEAQLNARPRKRLAYRTPADLMRRSVALQT
jgi:transposase, IS30 family